MSKNIGADMTVLATNLHHVRGQLDATRFPETCDFLNRAIMELASARAVYEVEKAQKVMA